MDPIAAAGRSAALLLSATLVGACAPSDPPSAGVTAPGAAAGRGAQLFSASCAACHQSDGHGIAHVYPSLAGSAIVLGDSAVLARWVIKGERPAAMPAGRYASVMPQFGWLQDADAAALLTHVRTSFGNQASAVDAAAVAAARALR